MILNLRPRLALAAFLMLGTSAPALSAEPAPMPLDKAAKTFGARPAVAQMSLSPDGKKIAYVGAAQGQASVLFVGDLDKATINPITYTDNKPLDLRYCGWSSPDRIVCQSYGLDILYAKRVSFTRLFAIDADGKNIHALAAPLPAEPERASQYDGEVIDWFGEKGQVLLARDHVPGQTTGTLVQSGDGGLGVDLVDTRTNAAKVIERPRPTARWYMTDGQGHVRMMGLAETDSSGEMLTGAVAVQYRTRTDGSWQNFSTISADGKGASPVAIEASLNAAYVLRDHNGRDALYRVALDGSMKEELLLENPRVDIDSVIAVNGHVIGATYTDERRVTIYFDPEYKLLAEQLGRAIPQTPLIDIEDATPDGDTLLLRASSDTDPGRFYVYQKSSHALKPLMSARPQLDGQALAEVKPIAYPSFDGTMVPAYLTLPPGSAGKHLPAIVMPHGGPGSRDRWGFDWLAQFFASRGFAVIQPEFRGSTGFGEAWFVNNGFKSWRTAIGDVNAAGHWLVSQGIADPSKLAMLRRESSGLTNEEIARAFIGSGALLDEASPARHAGAFKAPVLIFHGTRDINVGFQESVAMDDALHAAGKQSQLVRYPDLDHQLNDSAVRADMLTKADQFLRKSMGMAAD